MEIVQQLLRDPEIMGIIVAILVYAGVTLWEEFSNIRNSKASALARKIFWEIEDGKTSYDGGEDKEAAFDYLFDQGWSRLTGKKPSKSLKETAFKTVQEVNTGLKLGQHTSPKTVKNTIPKTRRKK